MCLYEHPAKDSATESTKAMVDTLGGKEILNAYLTIEHIYEQCSVDMEANTLMGKVKLFIIDS